MTLANYSQTIIIETPASKAAAARQAKQLKAWLSPPIYSVKLVREGSVDLPSLQVNNPQQIADLLMRLLGDAPQEHFLVCSLDRHNHMIGVQTVSMGSVAATQVRIVEVFRSAILCNACAIIVAHNHPSGDCTPSPEDIAVTREIVQAGKLLDVQVIDHLVIGYKQFASLKERGLGF